MKIVIVCQFVSLTMAMAKKYLEGGRIVTSNKGRALKHAPKVFNNGNMQCTIPKTATKGASPSPTKPHLSANSRTSPGLLAGHYAGCKFSDPPLPSTLPLPPKHWMQTGRLVLMPFHSSAKSEHCIDGTHQLKVLLKVQA